MMRRNKQKQVQRHCGICKKNVRNEIDYKNVKLIRRYISSFGKIVPRKRSGLCDACQRRMSSAIKRARIMALLPFVQK